MRGEADHDVSATRPVRRWPAALASLGVAAVVGLTAVLVVQDRSNTNAADSSRANAARDAAAVQGLKQVGRTIAYANVMASQGVVGLRTIGLDTTLDDLVSPLGGTLTLATGGWTLALGGGWACMTWMRHGGVREWRVRRGICPGAPIDATQPVAPSALRAALRRTEALERAALVAAFAAAASPGARRSVTELLAAFRGHASDLPFRWSATPVGISVITDASVACLRPLHHKVAVSLGACR